MLAQQLPYLYRMAFSHWKKNRPGFTGGWHFFSFSPNWLWQELKQWRIATRHEVATCSLCRLWCQHEFWTSSLIHTFECDGKMVFQPAFKPSFSLIELLSHWSRNQTVFIISHHSVFVAMGMTVLTSLMLSHKTTQTELWANGLMKHVDLAQLWVDCYTFAPSPHMLTPSAKLYMQQCISKGMQNRGNG